MLDHNNFLLFTYFISAIVLELLMPRNIKIGSIIIKLLRLFQIITFYLIITINFDSIFISKSTLRGLKHEI